MRTFAELFEMAAARKGGAAAVEALLESPRSATELAAIPDDRWLSAMTRCVFEAGFNWDVIARKWDGFEAAFEGFVPRRWAALSDDDLDRLLADRRIVRNARKIESVRDNAALLVALAGEHGSAARFFAASPPGECIALAQLLKKRGSRLGGVTGQRFLRRMGVDTVVFSDHVVAALVREGVVTSAPTSKRDLAACQAALDAWHAESGRPLNHVSRTLALTVEG